MGPTTINININKWDPPSPPTLSPQPQASPSTTSTTRRPSPGHHSPPHHHSIQHRHTTPKPPLEPPTSEPPYLNHYHHISEIAFKTDLKSRSDLQSPTSTPQQPPPLSPTTTSTVSKHSLHTSCPTPSA
ncbi:hypothetical protein HanRHA438_Chr04g0185211 [Helianthus annuus]|uniref:Uncharacterized protein n=1 Tax=Helianthus annuus TaxID=4232 RepID=A0A251V1H4_HELAN|nr:hypothetical protein HanXRQr2_Chr04g0175601 [Helianthus annuus]KAJ0597651.1 hypothetical protein HanHA89_Chr04g0157021 [Helianthus annuus]KAJ0927646.1 hypothetical protein HanRHA438_Chr04g0185211 [Helianthus annuus]